MASKSRYLDASQRLINTDLGSISPNFFHQAKKLLAIKRSAKKWYSILPIINSPDCRLKSIKNLPNLWTVHQEMFAKKKLIILFMQKSTASMLMKLTSGVPKLNPWHTMYLLSKFILYCISFSPPPHLWFSLLQTNFDLMFLQEPFWSKEHWSVIELLLIENFL